MKIVDLMFDEIYPFPRAIHIIKDVGKLREKLTDKGNIGTIISYCLFKISDKTYERIKKFLNLMKAYDDYFNAKKGFNII